jgi:hypothetical protein
MKWGQDETDQQLLQFSSFSAIQQTRLPTMKLAGRSATPQINNNTPHIQVQK